MYSKCSIALTFHSIQTFHSVSFPFFLNNSSVLQYVVWYVLWNGQKWFEMNLHYTSCFALSLLPNHSVPRLCSTQFLQTQFTHMPTISGVIVP